MLFKQWTDQSIIQYLHNIMTAYTLHIYFVYIIMYNIDLSNIDNFIVLASIVIVGIQLHNYHHVEIRYNSYDLV